MASLMVRVSHVTKRYSKRFALQDVSFDLDAGEFAYITGVSGAGKSTLLKLLFAMEKPTEGSIHVNRNELTTLRNSDLPEYRQKVGFIFQDFKLLPDLNVRENVSLPLDMKGMSKKEIQRRVEGVLSLVGLAGREKDYPNHLSGGEQQRVAIARAVVGQPSLLLADEPTGNLDSQNARDILALFQEIASMGTTVCLATHDEFLMSEYPARTIELRNGQIESDLVLE